MKIQLIGAALGSGAQDQRTESAPEFLNQRGLLSLLAQAGFQLGDFSILQNTGRGKRQEALPIVAEFNQRLAHVVATHMRQEDFPIILGGDHSVAVGTWSGVAASLPGEDLGLIWMDARMDAHTPETSPNGAVNGMPLAALLGYGDPRLTQIETPHRKIKPENVCVIGVRSFESAEAELLLSHGVRVYFIDEIHKRGFDACFVEAYQKVNQKTSRFGISMDLNALDPRDFPAVGSPCRNGLFLEEIRDSLRLAVRDPKLAAFELVEYSPELDYDRTGFVKIALLLEEILWARSLGKGFAYLPPAMTDLAKNMILQ